MPTRPITAPSRSGAIYRAIRTPCRENALRYKDCYPLLYQGMLCVSF